jgi:Exopolysaccharide synthesis, ExoD
MLLVRLALPFCLIPVAGLSTPFGIAVLLIGIRITFRQKPWLPKFIRHRRISAPRLVTGGIRFAKLMEKVVKPRMDVSAFLAGRGESNRSRYSSWGPAALTAASDSFQQHGACVGGSALDRGNDGTRRFSGAAESHNDARLLGFYHPCLARWRGRHPQALQHVLIQSSSNCQVSASAGLPAAVSNYPLIDEANDAR